jgi:hypothetical protein
MAPPQRLDDRFGLQAAMKLQLGKLDLLQRLQWVTCKTVTFLSEIAE